MDHQVLRVLKALCRQVGTPRALAVNALAQAGEWTQLQELRVKPSDYFDAESLRRDLAVTELLRKCSIPGDSKRKYEAAVKTFWSCEAQNAATNARLSRFVHNGPFEGSQDERLCVFIDAWRKKVSKVLGKLPARLTPRFSGGATYADKSKVATPPDKMTNRATYYPGCSGILPFFWESAWGRANLRNAPRRVRGNIFFTVPKDGIKDRGCAKEASIPVAIQLDVGSFLKDRLRLFGIDLKRGQALHQLLAKQASLDGRRATLDLSNASDTVAYLLVKLGLPDDWFCLFDSLRAPFTRVDGKWVRLEKFSSMGNGFTFELETLIFFTLAETLRDQMGLKDQVFCYGDDLIVQTELYTPLRALLAFFGFTVNEKKSFNEGWFRESCGGDYFQGESVRAHYLDEPPDEPQKWISLANGLRRLGAIGHAAWVECLKNIPHDIRRCRGPEELGDVVIHDDVIFLTPQVRHIEGHETWALFYRAYVPIPDVLPWHHWKPEIQYAGALLGLASSGVTNRGVKGYRLGWVEAPGNRWLPA